METAAELAAAAEREFQTAHVLLMAAAPADFRAADPASGKLRRSEGLDLSLEPTEDILASLASSRREGQTIVGFAAEHGGDAVERARGKLERKRLDAVVVNDISRGDIGFDVEANEVTIVTASGDEPVPFGPKEDVARAILDVVERLRIPTEAGAP